MTPRAATVVLVTLLGLGTSAAGSAPAAAAAAGAQTVCRIGDDRLVEISGLVATGDGYVVVNDGSDDPARRRIFYLDRRCKVVRTVAYPSRPRDTEDMALATDGTLWVADIGDNSRTRTTIALWRLAPGARKPRLYRMAYPDGPHDAETLLLTPAGAPIVVTKTAATAGLYVPQTPLQAGRTTPLRQAGSVTVPLTSTSNPFSLPGRLVITGGAVSPDGRHAVLRTYADAFEYDVSGGDLVGAVTNGTPRVIPLPDEPQGESIAYSPDGTALLTTSEVAGQPHGTKAALLRYPLADRAPSTSAPPSTATSPASGVPPPATAGKATKATKATNQPDGVPAGAWATGAILLVGGAALVLVLARRRSRDKRA